MLATHGAELVGCYITLMNADAPVEVLQKAIFIHPTRGEAVQSAAMKLNQSGQSK